MILKSSQTASKDFFMGCTSKILGAPSLYVQGPGILTNIGKICTRYGRKAMVICDDTVWEIIGKTVSTGLSKAGIDWQVGISHGECRHSEIERLSRLLKAWNCDHIIGMGGGKSIDTAKGVVIQNPTYPLVIVPTIAASDAATSRICVVYTSAGVLQETQVMKSNPTAVLVDSKIIAHAPVRFILAGMGDAIATKFEAEQCAMCHGRNSFGGQSTRTAIHISDACYRTIRESGLQARKDIERQLVTPSVENIIEACLYQSGLGFEGGGLSVAHGLTRGLSGIEELNATMHGELVAFGLLVQLVLEGRPPEFISDLIDFYRQLGLPCGLPDLGLRSFNEKHLETIANGSFTINSPIYHIACEITPALVVNSMAELHERYVRK